MNLNEYQKEAQKTAIYPREGIIKVLYPILGMCGESGEAAEKVKKALRDDNGVITEERRRAIGKELGDVLWYIAAASKELGYTLQEIAEMNLQKLFARREQEKIQGSGDNREEECRNS